MSAYSKIQLRKSSHRKVILIFTAIMVDAVVTVYLMCIGFEEGNPLLSWIKDPVLIAHVKITWSLLLFNTIMAFAWKEFIKYLDYLIIGYFVLYTAGFWSQIIWEVMI